MCELRDDELVALAITNPQAFASLYDRYFLPVHRYCRRRLGTREDAADATAQIFLNAFQGLPKLRLDATRKGSNFRSWLFSIAHNVVVDAYRRQRPTVSTDQPVRRSAGGTETTLSLADQRPGPEESALASDADAQLAWAMNQLPERHRAIIELRLAGLPQAEIAVVLGISAQAVRSSQFRAVARLRDLLNPSTSSSTSASMLAKESTHGS